MKVYVCMLNYGYEGRTEPKFATLELKEAKAWLLGCQDTMSTLGEC